MDVRIFDVFAKMIAGLPPQGILKALDLECEMLEADVKNDRLPLPDDASSILTFREFVQAAKRGRAIRCYKPLSPDHIEFYKDTIIRLVQANELPEKVMALFDNTFVREIDP